MKVSVITYCGEHFADLHRTIESVEKQVHEDLQHIIVLNSVDEELNAATKIVAHPDMVLISAPGISNIEAVNLGIEVATGEIVSFMPPTTFFSCSYSLSRIVDAFHVETLQAVCCDIESITRGKQAAVKRVNQGTVLSQKSLKNGHYVVFPALFIRREFLNVQRKLDTSFGAAAEYEALLRWFGKEEAQTRYIAETLVGTVLPPSGKIIFSFHKLKDIILRIFGDYRALRMHHIGGIFTILRKIVFSVLKARSFNLSAR